MPASSWISAPWYLWKQLLRKRYGLHDAGGDLSNANAVGLPGGQDDLNRLGGGCSCSLGLRHQAAHIDLAGDGGGDEGGAAFLEQRNALLSILLLLCPLITGCI